MSCWRACSISTGQCGRRSTHPLILRRREFPLTCGTSLCTQSWSIAATHQLTSSTAFWTPFENLLHFQLFKLLSVSVLALAGPSSCLLSFSSLFGNAGKVSGTPLRQHQRPRHQKPVMGTLRLIQTKLCLDRKFGVEVKNAHQKPNRCHQNQIKPN